MSLDAMCLYVHLLASIVYAYLPKNTKENFQKTQKKQVAIMLWLFL